MKKLFSLSLVLLFSLLGYTQSPDLTGEWVGIMSVDVNRTQQNVFVNFSLQIKQSGQAIWGIYTGGNKLSTDSCDCAGRLTSRVSREKGVPVIFYQDGIVHHTIPEDYCMNFNMLNLSYSLEDSLEILKGRWHMVLSNPTALEGAAGVLVLAKVADQPSVDVDQYFPRLQALIRRFNETQ
jgi:hypothetical protein